MSSPAFSLPRIGNIHDYYVHRAIRIAQQDNQPDTLPDAAAWEKQRPAIYQQYMRSLGLDCLPQPCDLKVTETGRFEGPGYTARKLAYQILPNCWGSAHLYRPADIPEDQPTPGVLYTCGHSAVGVLNYQYHAIGWARRGYTCLIFDTIQQHDNPGDHHGLNRGDTPDWIAMGYTAAGGEVYNGMRALDLLLAQPGVDPDRVGVTGLSGGGSQSFFLAAADPRLKAVATVCGISSSDYALANRHIHQHCDCIYVRNVFGRDVSLYGALIAPRALLYCNARHDGLFTPQEFNALYQRTRARFERLGHADLCQLCQYDGPHGYNWTQTTDRIHDWFDQHVARAKHPDVDTIAIRDSHELHDEPTLTVFDGQTPQPNDLDLLPRLLSRRGSLRLPTAREDWQSVQQATRARLRKEVFHLIDQVDEPQELEQVGHWLSKTGVIRENWHGRLDGMVQSLSQIAPANGHDAVLISLDDRQAEASKTAGRAFIQSESLSLSVLGIEPRAAGFNAFEPGKLKQFNREGCLVGLTPTMMMVQDLWHLWPRIKAMPLVAGRRLYLHGRGEGAIAMLYHALLHPDDVAGVVLEQLAWSHALSAHQIMGILRVLDIPQATGLLAPTPTVLVDAQGNENFHWGFPRRAFARLTSKPLLHTSNLAEAIATVMSGS